MTEGPHLVDAATGTPLCPEAEYRDYWDEEVPDEIEMQTLHIAEPCPECGELGACAVDAEGRALIHVIEEADHGA